MNNYIFDWDRNSQRILETNKYTTYHKQDREGIALIQYLSNQKKYNKEDIYSVWKDISGSKIEFLDDSEKRKIFDRFFKTSLTWKFKKGKSFAIYQEELDYLNSLIIPMWAKEYLLALLCVYKYYNDKWCVYTKDIKCFCHSRTKEGRSRPERELYLHNLFTRYNLYDLSMLYINNKEVLSIKVNYAKGEGKVIAVLETPNEVSTLFKMLKCEKKCKICGGIFSYTVRSFTQELCPICYKKERNRKKYLNYKTRHSHAIHCDNENK